MGLKIQGYTKRQMDKIYQRQIKELDIQIWWAMPLWRTWADCNSRGPCWKYHYKNMVVQAGTLYTATTQEEGYQENQHQKEIIFW